MVASNESEFSQSTFQRPLIRSRSVDELAETIDANALAKTRLATNTQDSHVARTDNIDPITEHSPSGPSPPPISSLLEIMSVYGPQSALEPASI